MPSTLYFTTGQTAQQLGASQAQIRALCESGAVEAETTPGGQYRIPAGELARLQREGTQRVPGIGMRRRRGQDLAIHLLRLGQPSDAVQALALPEMQFDLL